MGGPNKIKRQPDYQSERGERQEARMLDALIEGPMTSSQLQARMHLSRKNVCVYLDRLMAQPNRRVYICGFDLNKGRPKFIYDIGSKRDVTINAYQCNRLLAELQKMDRPISMKEVGAKLDMSYGTAKRYMHMLKEKKKVHIADWGWASTTPIGLYVAGTGEDAPKPKKRPARAHSPRLSSRTSIFAALGI